jgi:glycosyltransferase involved in cell wall biosynthesis
MKFSTKCSLIISTYNWPQALQLCLLSVRQQSVLPNEIIIADDGSGEDTLQVIEALQNDFPVRLVHIWQKDEGFQLSRIRNKAIAAASYDYVIQVDGDLILHRHFIKDHIQLSRPGSFITGSRVLMNQQLSEKLLQLSMTHIPLFERGIANLTNRLYIKWLRMYLADRYKPNDIFSLRGCNMAFWKDDLLRVNGYNEDFQGWGREDNEIAARLLNSGLKKRTIKFGGIVFHIYHPEADRSRFLDNQMQLSHTINDKLVYCDRGISQYCKVTAEQTRYEAEINV